MASSQGYRELEVRDIVVAKLHGVNAQLLERTRRVGELTDLIETSQSAAVKAVENCARVGQDLVEVEVVYRARSKAYWEVERKVRRAEQAVREAKTAHEVQKTVCMDSKHQLEEIDAELNELKQEVSELENRRVRV